MKFRPVHIFTFLIFLFSVGISTGKAYALPYETVDQSPALIATPYPTLTPIVLTPTQIPLNSGASVDFSCPVGVPAGYGTVTPSTEWEIACGHCFPTNTPPAFYTSTPGPTHTPWGHGGTALPPICITVPAGGEECYVPTLTPEATETLIPTVTSTVISTATLSPYVNFSVRYDQVDGSYTSNIETSLVCEPVVGTKGTVHHCIGTLSATDTSNAYISRIAHRIYFDQTEDINHIPNYYYVDNTGGSFAYSTIARTSSNNVANLSDTVYVGHHEGIVYSSQFSGFILLKFYSSNSYTYTGNFTATYDLYVSTDPFYNPYVATSTPSPTVTPLGEGFCEAVSNSTVPNQFTLGGTGGVTSQVCYVFPGIVYADIVETILPAWLSPFATVFNSIFPIEAGIDPLTFCIRQRDYSLYIFGYRFPYEAILGLGVFLASLRMFVPTAFSGVAMLGSTKDGGSSEYKVTSSPATRNPDGSKTRTYKRERIDK